MAMRDDLFVPDPTRSAKVNAFLKDLGSSLHVSWERSATNYGNLTQVKKRGCCLPEVPDEAIFTNQSMTVTHFLDALFHPTTGAAGPGHPGS